MLLKARAAPSRLEELGCKAKLYSLFNNDLMLCGLFARFYGKMYEYIQNTITISLKKRNTGTSLVLQQRVCGATHQKGNTLQCTKH